MPFVIPSTTPFTPRYLLIIHLITLENYNFSSIFTILFFFWGVSLIFKFL